MKAGAAAGELDELDELDDDLADMANVPDMRRSVGVAAQTIAKHCVKHEYSPNIGTCRFHGKKCVLLRKRRNTDDCLPT